MTEYVVRLWLEFLIYIIERPLQRYRAKSQTININNFPFRVYIVRGNFNIFLEAVISFQSSRAAKQSGKGPSVAFGDFIM